MKFYFIFSILLLLLTLAHTQEPLIVTTELDTVDANDGLFSLREAVADANITAGKQTIRFHENLFLPGANRIIYLKEALEFSDESGVNISGSGLKVTLDGSRIDTSAVNHKDGLVFEGGNNEIAYLHLKNFNGSAIVVDSLNPGGNYIGPGNQISQCRGAGVKIIDSENNTIRENDIWNCGSDSLILGDFEISQQAGILLLSNANNNSITGNACWSNHGSGIGSYFSQSNTLTRNYLALNNHDGITIHGGNGANTISENEFPASLNAAILLHGGNNSGNQITGNNIGDSGEIPAKMLDTRISSNPATKTKINIPDIPLPTGMDPLVYNKLKSKMIPDAAIIAAANGSGYSGNGIMIEGCSDILITGNYFTKISTFGIMVNGIQEIDSSGAQPDTSYAFPEEIRIEGNRFNEIAVFGIYYMDAYELSIQDNFFMSVMHVVFGLGISSINPGEVGLDSTDRGRFTIADNIMTGKASSNFAINIIYAKKVIVENNEIDRYISGCVFQEVGEVDAISNRLSSLQSLGIYAVNCSNVLIQENTVEDNQQYGFLMSGGNICSVINNILHSTGIYGVLIENFESVTFRSNLLDKGNGNGLQMINIRYADIDSNRIENTMYAGISATAIDTLFISNNVIQDQAYLHNVTLDTIRFLRMHHNEIKRGMLNGILASEVDSLIFYQNIISDCNQMGMQIDNTLFASVTDNHFYNNRMFGLSVSNMMQAKISNNNFSLNFYGIYAVDLDGFWFTRNNIVENSEVGLALRSDSIAICDSNYFSLNNTGFILSSYDSLQLRYNSFVSNSNYGVEYEGADSVDARMNYWGHPEGPTVGDSLYPGSRLGDKVTKNVLYDPFLTEPVIGSSLKPVISSLTPKESVLEGGAEGELRGVYFMPGVQVYFGSDTVLQLRRVSSEILRFVVPAGDSGYVDVIVGNTGGMADTLKSGFYYIPEEEPPLSVAFDSDLPRQYALYSNYPNPFNPVTTIRYDIVNPLHVELSVYNLLGQKIAVLANGQHVPGRYAVTWDATAFASGMYIYVLKSKLFNRSRKLLLIK